MQFFTEGGDYDASSTDKTKNQKGEVFDFKKLVASFDAYLATQKSGSWAITSNLAATHLFGSDTMAIGGDFSYQYALNASLSGIGVHVAQAAINSQDFVSLLGQTLHTRAALELDTVFMQ